VRLPLTALAVALVCSACSGSSDHALPSRTPTPATTTAAPPEPVDPLSPRPAVESSAPAGGPTCLASDLTVTDADLLASDTALEEVFAVRTSGSPCELRGWPTVRLLDSEGRRLPLTVQRVRTASVVALSRGTSVSFVLGTPRTSSCQDAATLLVRLPGTDRAIRVPTTMQVCERRLDVGPVERRQDDEGTEH
jgi:hypothetical protein